MTNFPVVSAHWLRKIFPKSQSFPETDGSVIDVHALPKASIARADTLIVYCGISGGCRTIRAGKPPRENRWDTK